MTSSFLIGALVFTIPAVFSCKIPTKTTSKSTKELSTIILDDPKNPLELTEKDVQTANTAGLITYCAKETAATATPEEKKWLDAFSLEVMERICNKEPEASKQRIDLNLSKHLESSWTDGLNLTGVTLGGYARGTAITPRHVIYTKHYGYHGQVGETLWFLTLDNRPISRKIVAVKYVDIDDIAIVRLDSDLPGSITPLRLLDYQAAQQVPSLVPMLRINQHNKALLVERRHNQIWKPGEAFGTVLTNPPERAYAQYYQDMVRFDSSSPTILLLRNEYGVMPILFSLVTFGGPGSGPALHHTINQIQQVITSFGDPHNVQLAMPPVTPHVAPSCSILATRANDGVSCDLVVKGSADPVTGNPSVQPTVPSSWSQKGNTWTGKVACSADQSTVFTATLTGPGGTGRSCESGALGPVLPQCGLSVVRRGNTATCDVEVIKFVGNPTGNPVLSPSNPSDWVSTGGKWTGTTSCAVNAVTQFKAKLTDTAGTGPECTSTAAVYSEIPTCELTRKRVGYSDTCELTVTRKSGSTSGNPAASPVNPTNWVQTGDQFKGTATCSTEGNTTFSASLSGAEGTGPICKSPTVLKVPVEIPFCEMTAARIGLTNVCKLNVNHIRGWIVDGPPVATPRNPVDWKQIPGTNNFEGTAPCAFNGYPQFSAYLPGQNKTPGRVCSATPIDKIPAPSCSVIVSRQQTTSVCDYAVTATSQAGTITSFSIGATGTRAPWTGAAPATGQFTCSQVAQTPLDISVWGPGVTPQTSSCQAVATALPPPSCKLVAKRRKRTSTCDLTLTGSGILDTSKALKISPSGSGRWNGMNWSGTGTCGTNRQTAFSTTVFGPGGSQASCRSNTIPRL